MIKWITSIKQLQNRIAALAQANSSLNDRVVALATDNAGLRRDMLTLKEQGNWQVKPNDTEWQKRFQELDSEYDELYKEFQAYRSRTTKDWQESIVMMQAVRDLKRAMGVLTHE